MTDDVTRLVEAARALLQTKPSCTVEAPCRTCALRDALVPFFTPAPAKCGTCGGAGKIEKETRAPQLDGRSAVLRYTEDCPACGGGR